MTTQITEKEKAFIDLCIQKHGRWFKDVLSEGIMREINNPDIMLHILKIATGKAVACLVGGTGLEEKTLHDFFAGMAESIKYDVEYLALNE